MAGNQTGITVGDSYGRILRQLPYNYILNVSSAASGITKEITENRLKVFIELNGDAGISKLNENNGTFRTQSLGFGTGLRYIFDLRKKEK